MPESVRFVVLPCVENHNSTTSTSTVGGTVGGTSGLVEPIDLQEIKASKESYRRASAETLRWRSCLYPIYPIQIELGKI